MSVDHQFEEAAIQAKSLPNQSNETLLKLYALYKQATKGDVAGSKPGAFDFRGRAKYDAWAGLLGTGRDDAKQQYIELVKSLMP